MIKVLHFYGEGIIGGGQQRAQYHLLKSLSEEPDIKVGCAILKESGFYVEKIRELGIPIVLLNINGGFDLRFRREVIAKFKEYDIHHLHDPSPNIIIYSLLAGKKIRRVFTRRGGIAHYGLDIKKQLKFLIKKILLKKYFDGFSGNSFNAVRSIQTQYGIKDINVFTIYNGTDFSDLEATLSAAEVSDQLKIIEDDFVIGTTGRLVDCKRVDLLIRAFAMVKIISKKLIIIGDGPERKKLEKLSTELNLNEKVIFGGVKAGIGNYLQIMDAFVLASGQRESFGNSVVEAMYFKVPSVIMKDSLGLLEHITDNETGFVAADENDLARKLEYIYQHKEEAKKIGEKASAFVKDKYTYENMVKSLKKFYYSVLT